jgi:hypothetical protein
VYYQPGNENYQGYGGSYYAIYALTFDINWNLSANTLYGFGVDAVPTSGTGNQLFLASSSVPLSVASGATENASSDEFVYWEETAGQGSSTPQFAGYCDATCQGASGFNGSVVDAILTDAPGPAPEPGTFALFGLGLSACAIAARRRVKA